MSKQVILQELRFLVYENFGIEVFDISKSLFSFDIGFVPRNLVKLVMLIEHKFNVRFSESELARDDFDCLEEMAAIIYAHLGD